MKAGAWREQAINAVDEMRAGDPRMLDRLALLLQQQDETAQALRELGQPCTVDRLVEAALRMPGIEEIVTKNLATVVEDAIEDAMRSGIEAAMKHWTQDLGVAVAANAKRVSRTATGE